MKTRFVLSLLVIALPFVAASLRAEEKTSLSARRLEALKQLAGDWVQVGKDGKATDQVASSIRVTSGGSTVQETMFPGTDHEMITMYHLDGDDLILTHYCSLGNQPKLKADPGKDVNTIVFKYVSCTNLKSKDDHHINGATLTLEGKDHFKAEWTSCQNGKACHQVNLDLVRKTK